MLQYFIDRKRVKFSTIPAFQLGFSSLNVVEWRNLERLEEIYYCTCFYIKISSVNSFNF